jgi:1-deoxyxylulose-5-phosphate synthase
MRKGPNGAGLSRKAILTEIDASLRRLGTDYVDLYQIHRWDPDTPIEETLEALHDVVKAGKARYIGASSMYAWQFAKALHLAERHGWTRFVSRCRTTTTCCTARRSARCCRCARPGHGRDPVEPAGPRRSPATGTRRTARAETDEFGRTLYDTAEPTG